MAMAPQVYEMPATSQITSVPSVSAPLIAAPSMLLTQPMALPTASSMVAYAPQATGMTSIMQQQTMAQPASQLAAGTASIGSASAAAAGKTSSSKKSSSKKKTVSKKKKKGCC